MRKEGMRKTIYLLLIMTIVLATVFNVSENYGGATGAPRWVSALIWGAFYFELAFLLPRVEEFARRRARKR